MPPRRHSPSSGPREREPSRRARSLRSAWVFALCAALPGCHTHATSAASDAGEAKRPARGDWVVVEQTAAEFFEGRVLGANGDQLRVEVPGKNGSVLVALGDVYRLPPPVKRPSPAELAICNSARHVWVPCRIVRAVGATISVKDAEERDLELSPTAILTPTAVTELNLRRYFERNQARAAFAASAAAAGAPRVPKGWHPMPQERVLARDGAAWFSAHIHEIGEDQMRVSWDSDRQVSVVDPAAIVPQPPYDVTLARGAFVLLRPPSTSQPWRPVRVRRVAGSDLGVDDVDGNQIDTNLRDVVPLGMDSVVHRAPTDMQSP